MPGTLALVGGAEWRAGCDFDRELLELSGSDEVLVLPTAAAYEHPDRIIEAAERWFGELGAKVRAVDVLTRPDATDQANAAPIRARSSARICSRIRTSRCPTQFSFPRRSARTRRIL